MPTELYPSAIVIQHKNHSNKVLIESKNSLLIGKPLVQFHCTDIIQINTGVLQTKELTILPLIFQVFYHKN